MFLGPTFSGLEYDFEKSPIKLIIHLVGLPLFVLGWLDGLGIIGRSSVKAAIREENERMRGGKQ
jgi:hypothetical protein